MRTLSHFISLPYVSQIPHGKKYDKKWLLGALQNICSVPFKPVQVRDFCIWFNLKHTNTFSTICSIFQAISLLCRMDYVVAIYHMLTFFFPLQYHVVHNRASFYIDDAATATALHKCSHKITDRDGYKVFSYFFKQFYWCIPSNWNIVNSHTQIF